MTVKQPFTRPSADGLPVAITEVSLTEGGFLPVPRGWALILFGRSLPNQEISRKAKLRYKKTYYAGREDASVQVLGKAQEPFTLEGYFMDDNTDLVRALGEGDGVTLAGASREQADYLWAMFYSAATVRVTWGKNWDMVCVIKSVEAIEYRHKRIGYKITFDPITPNEAHKRFQRDSDLRRRFQRVQDLDNAAASLRAEAQVGIDVLTNFRTLGRFLRGVTLDDIGPGAFGGAILL